MADLLVSFVIPCYNSENIIVQVIDEIVETVSRNGNYGYEIIAVCDDSPDNVFEVLKTEAKEDTRIRVINLAKNAGKHAAMMAGFRLSQGDIIVGLDDDGQCPTENLDALLRKLDEGYDAVFAQYTDKRQGVMKDMGSRINNIMGNVILGKDQNVHFSNFFALNRLVVNEMTQYTNPYPYIEGLVLRATRRIANVEMVDRPRIEGQTGFGLKKSLSLWLNGFTAFSVRPLRLATIIGILSSMAGAVYALILVIRKLMYTNIQIGYSSQMCVMLILGGLVLFTLGLIGEYVGRIYICINNAPQYIVRETFNVGLQSSIEEEII